MPDVLPQQPAVPARARVRLTLALALTIAAPSVSAQTAPTPVAGPNVNMLGGPALLRLSPFEVLGEAIPKAQNEPSCGISSRNPLHILCAANDYRMVDVPGVSATWETRDAWQGVFQSVDGGSTWQSTLHPGFFLDPAPHLLKTLGFRAAADPTVRTGPGGPAWNSFIAFSPADRDEGGVFVSTWIDLNNVENDKMPFKLVRTVRVDRGNAGQFIDKPWMFVDGPNGSTCTFDVSLPDGRTIPQTIPGSTVHLAYSIFVGNDNNIRTKLMYTRSFDCGLTWDQPMKLSESYAINQGSAITKPLVTGSNRIYTGWRRFRTDNGSESDAVMTAVSNDNGRFWTKAVVVANICPFDQHTTKTSFRTSAFPSMAADATGRVYMVWADRGRDPMTKACLPGGAARIMISSSADGVTWTPPVQAVPSSGPEHQIFPSLTFAGGLLHLAWLDFLEDASRIYGPFVDEAPLIDLARQGARVNRHTGDMRAAMARPGAAPVFNATKVSKYIEGVHRTPEGGFVRQQLQWHAVNRRWAKKGLVPFNGDYVDAAAVMHLPPDPASGRNTWTLNNGTVPFDTSFLVAWTDNRDMRRFPGVENPDQPIPWAAPVLPDVPPGASFFDPTRSRPVCAPGQIFATGTMNQNVYAARVSQGFLAGSPGNNKPLGKIQRAFVVFVRNDSDVQKTFLLRIPNQPAGGKATFGQFDLVPTSPPELLVVVPRRSSAARTVYVTPLVGSPVPLDPNAVIRVDVTEVVATGTGAQTSVFLNSDPSAPEIDSPEIDSKEIYTPEIDSPEIDSPEIDSHGFLAPEIDSPEIDSPEIDSATLLSLGLQTPEIDSPEIDSPEIDSPEIDSPEIDSPEIDSSAITDFTFKVTNGGNTTAEYSAKAFVGAATSFHYQLIVRKKYMMPAVDASCNPTQVPVTKVLANINSVGVGTPEIDSPEIDSSAPNVATFYVEPGETVFVTLRTRSTTGVPSLDDVGAADLAVQQAAVDTSDAEQGITQPPLVTTFLLITTSALPIGTVWVPYSHALEASGGIVPLSWSTPDSALLAPIGLSLTGAGVLSGTPTTSGTFTFTVQVQDSSASPQTHSKSLSLTIVQSGTASLSFVTQPTDTRPNEAISPAVSVRLLDSSSAPVAGASITMSIASGPAGGTLSGTTTQSTGPTGVAVFPDLRMDNPGAGYTLRASGDGLTAISTPFTIIAPDLIVDSLTHLPATPTTADTITFTAVVKNIGTGSAQASTLLFKVGGETPGAEGTLFAVPALAPGQTFTVERQTTLPPGSYVNTATADFTATVAESNETNNTATDAYTVSEPAGPQTFTVSNTNDSGPGSLRQAIIDSNAHAGFADTILFAIPGTTPHTIAPQSPLPGIDDPVIIDAAPGGDCSGVPPTIEIDGVSAGAGVSGLVVTSGGTMIRGLAITRFFANGIVLQTGGNNVIECNYIGIAPDGTTAKGNGANGVHVIDSPNNTIGGATSAVWNVISANTGSGVSIIGSGASGNLIQGNFVGVDATGAAALGNGFPQSSTIAQVGIFIYYAPSNSISGNTISANREAGVSISGESASGNAIQQNRIGTNAAGTSSLGNAIGVWVFAAPSNVIGGTATGAGNLISGNSTDGIRVHAASGTLVQGNFIGTNLNGTVALPNGQAGVHILHAASNTIGGTAVGARNLLSGNGGAGTRISGAGATGNLVQGNFIGTNAAGTAALGNTFGVHVLTSAFSNTIGGTVAGAGNLISGNATGIEIHGLANANLVQGNTIGLNASGTAALGNSSGVVIHNGGGAATNNIIGGTAPAARNIISGNIDGIVILGAGTTGNQVRGNYIGTNAAGDAVVGTGTWGVLINTNAANNTIGGTEAGAGNVISGHSEAGVAMNAGATGNVVQGNLIGLNAAGTAALGNTVGVFIQVSSTSNMIGGTTAGAGNVISGNTQDGVRISGAGSTGNQVQGNYIGLKPNGTDPLGNGGQGVEISNAAGNTVGGTVTGARNLVSGNNGAGIRIISAGATGNLVQGNFIGTDVSGSSSIPNAFPGVWVIGASGNTIGGSIVGARNVISGNGSSAGVLITLATSTNNLVQGNLIGTNAAGTAALGNHTGVLIETEASGNTIGGDIAGAGNVLSGNLIVGVHLDGSANNNLIRGNLIGTDASGTAALGNAGPGIILTSGAANNVIGGTDLAAAQNTIAFNGGPGIIVGSDAGSGNRLRFNRIDSNTGLGIDLGYGGVTANDPGDADTGPNDLQNFPVLASATSVSGTTTVQGSLNSTASTLFVIDFFNSPSCDPSGNGEGQTWFGSLTQPTDGSGNLSFNVSIGVPLTAGSVVTALATSPGNSTSEFSACVTVNLPDLIVDSLTHSPANPTTVDTITFTAVVKNIGTGSARASTLLFTIGGETPGAEGTLFPVPALAPGATFTVQRQMVLSVAQGYQNTATADFNNEVGESNETNNTTIDQYTVGQSPDLIVDSLTHSPANPTTADTITFTAVVKNIGTGSAPASTLLFTIGGETPGAQGTLFPVPALAPGATFTVQRQMVLSVPQGYQNTATADFNNDVGESNETNNTATDSYIVTQADSPEVSHTILGSLTPGQVITTLGKNMPHPGLATVSVAFPLNSGLGDADNRIAGDLVAYAGLAAWRERGWDPGAAGGAAGSHCDPPQEGRSSGTCRA